MQSKQIDRNLTILGLVLIFISAYYLFFGQSLVSSDLTHIAKITLREQLVRTKKSFSLEWTDAIDDHGIVDQQMIYTYKGSRAQVTFLQGQEILIEENSLVKIEQTQNQDLSIEKGFVRTKLSADKPLKVQIKGESYTLEGKNAEIQLSLNGNKESIGVLSGDVQLSKGSEDWKLDQSKALDLTGGGPPKIVKISVIDLFPYSAQKIYGRDQEQRIHFKWNNSHRESEIIVAKDAEFKSIIKKSSELDQEFVENFSEGKYYWQIKDTEGESLISQFEVIMERPPILYSPLNGEDLVFTEDGPEKELKFIWKKEAKSYLLEIDWGGEVKEFQTEQGVSTLPIDRSGKLRWRVKIADTNRPEALFSSWQTIGISYETLDGTQIIQLKRPDQKIKIEWENNQDEDVLFELAEDKSFNQVLVKKEGKIDKVEFNLPKLGRYYWKSQTRSGQNLKAQKIIIEPTPAPGQPQKLPDLEIPLEWEEVSSPQTTWWEKIKSLLFISEAFAEDGFKSSIHLEIPTHPDIEFYQLEIFSDVQLTQKVFGIKSKNTKVIWTDATPGQYYWRYAVIDYFGRQSPFSDSSKLTILAQDKPIIEKPRLRHPIRKELVKQDEKGISFLWTQGDQKTSYQLDVSSDENFENILVSEKTNKNEFFLTQDLPQDQLLFWRITAHKQKWKVSSNTGRFIVMNSPEKKEINVEDTFPPRKTLSEKRAEFLWAPSMDKYSFTNTGIKGDIAGIALMSFLGRYQWPGKWVNGEFNLIRQSGRVFKEESYLYQLLQVKLTKNLKESFIYGLHLGSVSGQSYKLEGGKVRSDSVSGMSYGPSLGMIFSSSHRREHLLNLDYHLGAIPSLDLSLRNFYYYHEKRHLSFEFGVSSRDYNQSSYKGKQTSTRLGFGWGFLFDQ